MKKSRKIDPAKLGPRQKIAGLGAGTPFLTSWATADLGGYQRELLSREGVEVGTWHRQARKTNWKRNAARKEIFVLAPVPLERIPKDVLSPAIELARHIYRDLLMTGCLKARPQVEMLWVEVVATLALQPALLEIPSARVPLEFGGIENAWKYLATGLESVSKYSPGGNHWAGWRSKMGDHPFYCLRESFLRSMRGGWGVRSHSRWENHSLEWLYWERSG
jgi:hypothetical protein